MFEKLIPILKPYSQYFYWKSSQYELMLNVAQLVNAKSHLTSYGFKTIIEIVYSYSNKRSQSKKFWIDVIESRFNSLPAKIKSGENNIQAVYRRGTLSKKIIAWAGVRDRDSL